MTTSTHTDGEAQPAPRRSRERISWPRFAQEFRAAYPELFDPYDKPAIRDAMIEAGVPRSALEDLIDDRLGLDRPALDPNHRRKVAQPASREERERQRQDRAATLAVTKDREKHVSIRTIGLDFVMSDGRVLGDWTIAELRKLNDVFGFILAKAGKKDDSRRVRDVMTAADWKRAAGAKP
jgi:hypothetical protein